jgi:hypothetical protein
MRSFCVEAALLLVEGGSGRPLPPAPKVLAADQTDSRGAHLEVERHQQMVESIASAGDMTPARWMRALR